MKNNSITMFAPLALLGLLLSASAEELKPTAAAPPAKSADTAPIADNTKSGAKPTPAVPDMKKLPTPGLVSVKPAAQPTPAPPKLPPIAEGPLTHTVRKGETLSAIARRYGLKTAKLQSWNRLPNPDKLRIGQRLLIPGASVAPRTTKSPKSEKSASATTSASAKPAPEAAPEEIHVTLTSK